MNIQQTCTVIGALLSTMLVFFHSEMYDLISFGIGFALILAGLSKKQVRSKNAAFGFGIILLLLGLGGFLLGATGENPFVLIPGEIEFETYNHSIHFLLGIILLYSFYVELKKEKDFSRITVYLQTRSAR